MAERKRALITGITGQDGSYLAEFLLQKDYDVHGIIRRSSSFNTGRINHIYKVSTYWPLFQTYLSQDSHEHPKLTLHYGDMADATVLRRVVGTVMPHEIYNLAAQSHVRVSFLEPEYTGDVTGLGALRLLDVIRDVEENLGWRIKCYQASSSEMFGSTPPPQNEGTPFHPRSPYAVAKVCAFWYGVNYREAYGLFVANGILFNHESPRRGETFVTRKITRAATRIKMGLQDTLYLGNIEARRDWGFAGDYVEAMWLMLQQDKPDDFVVATGESYSVREFLDECFGILELDWKKYVKVDPSYFRPSEVDILQGDCTKVRLALGWKSATSFKSLVKMMVEHDLRLAENEKLIRDRTTD